MTGPAPFEDEKREIRTLVAGPLENNVYLLACRHSGRAVVIDAAEEPDLIVNAAAGFEVTAILTSHGHADHVGAARTVAERLQVPVRIHEADAAMAGLTEFDPITPGEVIAVGDLRLQAIHTPGHTPGSTCFLHEEVLFSGDTLFPGGPGATADPDRFAEIMGSLESHLFVLPDSTRVLPGHGLDTTIGAERASLPEWWRRGY